MIGVYNVSFPKLSQNASLKGFFENNAPIEINGISIINNETDITNNTFSNIFISIFFIIMCGLISMVILRYSINFSMLFWSNCNYTLIQLSYFLLYYLQVNLELEKRVVERTEDLAAKTAELERINRVFVDRELTMRELKARIIKLEEKELKDSRERYQAS